MENLTTKYRLEWNAENQKWHMDDGNHEPNTVGWKTISDYCTDDELFIIDSYAKRMPKPWSVAYLLKCKKEFENLINELAECNLFIHKVL